MEKGTSITILANKDLRESNRSELSSTLELQLKSNELFLFSMNSDKDLSSFFITLNYLIKQCAANPFCKYSILSLIEVLKHIGEFLGGHTEKIDVERLRMFLQAAKVYVTDRTFYDILEKHVKDKHNITIEELDTICLIILKKPEFRGIFLEYAGRYGGKETENVMNYIEFRTFYKTKNNEDISKSFFNEMCLQLKNPQLIHGLKATDLSKELSFIEFTNIIFSDWNSAMDYQKSQLGSQKMTEPISHYFINTSHNTYLTGNQIGGEASCMGYYEALCNGCRCMEIDIWDGNDGEPIVTHGGTLTTIILFKDVVNCIAKWAFRFSDTPVILSFEDHCSIPQKEKVRDYCKNYFGSDLYYLTEKDFKASFPPSMIKMRRKILLKTKSMYRFKRVVQKFQKTGLLENEEASKKKFESKVQKNEE